MESTAAAFGSSVTTCVEEHCTELVSIWRAIGLEACEITARGNEVLAHMERFVGTMLSQEREQLEEMRAAIAKDSASIRALAEELDMEANLPSVDLPLVQQDELIGETLDALQAEREQRLESIVELESRLQTVQTSLVLDASTVADATISEEGNLSLERIESLQSVVSEYERELEDRKACARDVIHKSRQLWDAIGRTAQSELEEQFLAGLDHFPLSPSNLIKLQKLREELKVEHAERKKAMDAELEEIKRLYHTLEIPQEDRDAFLTKRLQLHSLTPVAFAAVDAERARLVSLRQAHIGKFVAAAERRLEAAFDACHYGPRQRAEATPKVVIGGDTSGVEEAAAAAISEHSLMAIEAAAERVEAVAAKHDKIFTLVTRHRNLIKKAAKLAANRRKSRLNNRGGALLKEEKLRKATEKELPRVEAELERALKAYQHANNGAPLLIDDVSYLTTMKERARRQRAQKEAEAEEKRLERKRRLEEEAMYGAIPATPKARGGSGVGGASGSNCGARTPARNQSVRKETPARGGVSTRRTRAMASSSSSKEKARKSTTKATSGKDRALKDSNAVAITANTVSKASSGYGNESLRAAFDQSESEVQVECDEQGNFSRIGTFDDFEYNVPMRSSVLEGH